MSGRLLFPSVHPTNFSIIVETVFACFFLFLFLCMTFLMKEKKSAQTSLKKQAKAKDNEKQNKKQANTKHKAKKEERGMSYFFGVFQPSKYQASQPTSLAFPQGLLNQQQQQQPPQLKKEGKSIEEDGRQPKQQGRCRSDDSKEKSNRCKILTDDGTARFGTVYDVCTLPPKHRQQQQQETRRVQFMRYTAIRDIKKSAVAKRNKVKIARAGEKLCMLGDPAAGSEAEVFVFKEGWDVYKRVWGTIKDDVAQGEAVEMTVCVGAHGTFDKRRGRCFMAHLGRGKESDVWISERWWEAKCAEQQAGFLRGSDGSGAGGGRGDGDCEGFYVEHDYDIDRTWLL